MGQRKRGELGGIGKALSVGKMDSGIRDTEGRECSPDQRETAHWLTEKRAFLSRPPGFRRGSFTVSLGTLNLSPASDLGGSDSIDQLSSRILDGISSPAGARPWSVTHPQVHLASWTKDVRGNSVRARGWPWRLSREAPQGSGTGNSVRTICRVSPGNVSAIQILRWHPTPARSGV